MGAMPEWVSWFEADGQAHHYPVDSPRGQWILDQLAGHATPAARCCAVPGCDKPARARSATCSPAHARAIQRVRDKSPDVAVRGVSGVALPDEAPTATNDALLPGDSQAANANTAHISETGRRCANCGRDISDRRADAMFCKGSACRMALTRRARAIAARAEVSDVLGQPALLDVDTGGRL